MKQKWAMAKSKPEKRTRPADASTDADLIKRNKISQQKN